ncbi:hypothetical protein Tco_0955908 [Tanacetum coccineum]|uniref:Reverse transcriptase domain-containing protein n=1 Tax=Tanacetum coccineum TaxID=301880 RepID=A0ABQ5E8H2_9ASTR
MSVEEIIFPPIRNRTPSVDPILISVQVYRRQVGRVLLDGGAACDIIYEHCFLMLRNEVRERRKDIYTTLSGFFVQSDSSQNILFGRTAIAELEMIPSTMHFAVLYSSKIGPIVIMSEYQDIRRREQIKGLKESLPASLMVSECVTPEEKVMVNQKHPEQTVTVGRQLPTQFKQKLVKLLRDFIDIFAWEYSNMIGIPVMLKIGYEIFITEQKLNEDKKIKHVQQKKRGMAPK